MSEVSATVSGGDQVAKEVEKQLGHIAQSALLSTLVEAMVIAADAQRRCPVGETGELRASIRAVAVPGGARVVCGGQGPSARYAGAVHERTYAKHDQGEAKFLEHAFQTAAGNVASNIAKRMQYTGKDAPVPHSSAPAAVGVKKPKKPKTIASRIKAAKKKASGLFKAKKVRKQSPKKKGNGHKRNRVGRKKRGGR